MTFEQLRYKRACMMCEEFINEGSPREVNISKGMRENIQKRIELNDISKVMHKPIIQHGQATTYISYRPFSIN